jgi:hypothetical protein
MQAPWCGGATEEFEQGADNDLALAVRGSKDSALGFPVCTLC